MLFIPELQLRLKSEVSETEERKNAQIEDIRFEVFSSKESQSIKLFTPKKCVNKKAITPKNGYLPFSKPIYRTQKAENL